MKRTSISQKEKARIRKSKEWAALREEVAARFNHHDPITGDKLRTGWNLHHVDQDASHYDDFKLEDDFGIPRFLPLNRSTHDVIHSLYRSATRKKNPLQLEKYFNNLLQRLKEMMAINK